MILSRERCAFNLYHAPTSLTGRAALAAARLRAQSDAPYQEPGVMLCRKGGSFGLWSWDARWVSERLIALGYDPRVQIIPETFFQYPLDGWRLIKLLDGYDAQYWSGDFLYASVWRRRRFETADWANVLRMVPVDESKERLTSPPQLQAPNYTLKSPYRRSILSIIDNRRYLVAVAVALVSLLICATAFLFGQTVKLNQRANALEKERALKVQTSATSQLGAIQAQVRQLSELSAITRTRDPLMLVAAAQRVVQPFGFKIQSFSADSEKVQITLPMEAVAGVEQIAVELSASPYFSDAKPSIDRQKRELVFELQVRPSLARDVAPMTSHR